MGAVKNMLRKIIPLRTSTYLIGRKSIERKLGKASEDIDSINAKLDGISQELSEMRRQVSLAGEIASTADARISAEAASIERSLWEIKAYMAKVEKSVSTAGSL